MQHPAFTLCPIDRRRPPVTTLLELQLRQQQEVDANTNASYGFSQAQIFGGMVDDVVFNNQQIKIGIFICIATRIGAKNDNPRRLAGRCCNPLRSGCYGF